MFGLSHLHVRDPLGESSIEGGLKAHTGVSVQAAASRRVDVRADLQILLPFSREPAADPRAVMAIVWHR